MATARLTVKSAHQGDPDAARQQSHSAATPAVHVVSVIGSMQPQSTSRALACAIVDALTAGRWVHAHTHDIIDLSQPCATSAGQPAFFELHRRARTADLLVVATPTYHGTYSGLLKAFLDPLHPGALVQTTAVIAVIDPAGRGHSATATLLVKILTSVGARLPTRPLVVNGPGGPRARASRWAATHGTAICAALSGGTTP
ncbi:NADPH-dependent FMN reductase [Paractinoplanes globisporus]|uniref:NADPH-dependent FMN reductase n=1 Tax=Paractinoplanes globisporus TaxID=113565 RepID=A0ABW6WG37_9ACTN|nr:NAD(P)H-dependent oxidoreductase [Actinoplanes globisporus]